MNLKKIKDASQSEEHKKEVKSLLEDFGLLDKNFKKDKSKTK